jgi:hypothetical protein
MHLKKLYTSWAACLDMTVPQRQSARLILPEWSLFRAENLLLEGNFTILDFSRIPSLSQNWAGRGRRFRNQNWQSPNWDARYERHPSIKSRQHALGYCQPFGLGEALPRLAWL